MFYYIVILNNIARSILMKKATRKTSKSNPSQPSDTWHKKIALSREKNKNWKKNLAKGKLKAALNPSVIRLARLQKGLDQGIVSKKIGVSASTFGSIELGKRLVKKDTANLIAKVLGKSLDSLFASSEVPNKFVAAFSK
jgi:DNA-binding XRE family transcriptional regulator